MWKTELARLITEIEAKRQSVAPIKKEEATQTATLEPLPDRGEACEAIDRRELKRQP